MSNLSSIPQLFQVRGAIEGFYGVFYTAPERDDLIRFLGRLGYSHYLYAPKNDRQHRARWREPYPDFIIQQFACCVVTALEAGLEFCYAISPGGSICYSGTEDFQLLTAKLHAFYSIGVRTFYLLLDDITPDFQYTEDRGRYENYAVAHAELCNRVYEWLQVLDPGCRLGMCPTYYHGVPPFSGYISTLGALLHPAIDIFYTGPDVCSRTIGTAEVSAFAEAARRLPILWDNYPVNDLMMQSELHIGPIIGRDAGLGSVTRGIVSNLMIQAEASKIALMTYSAYFANPPRYEPEAAWNVALEAVAGSGYYEPLLRVAENVLFSCLGSTVSPLDRLGSAALSALQQGEPPDNSPAVRELLAYLTDLDEACYQLRFRMQNIALRNNLLPWIDLLEQRLWMARRAVQVIAAIKTGQPYTSPLSQMRESLDAARRHHKRTGGEKLHDLAMYALAVAGENGLNHE